ncbi:DNA topoisomerase 3 [Roseibacillus ishigakijimensis]|uniref:DNA topoisomerase n=1 Tax=Roseibacillus ishigakijimensis TaxID=454146 RepID=A0A934RR92_9BACT|nr:DNA topoisomerase 3 [Roseibacillus ishigakijimensis]MBK1833589.1 DNA topoisomerase 3 [Roseibacillus ishigakijimensis]
MAKTLIIAEKPSVATDLSRALASKLGKFEKKGKSRDSQYFENENAAITSAVGHLVELKMPTGPNGKNLPWKFDVLPAIPQKFDLQPIEQSEGRLKHVLSLAKKKEFDLIVNACDAGREGELIFQYIMEIGNIQKPVKRLWMQSMTTKAIQEAWDKLREGQDMANLRDAAKCRSESDWLVGLNSTRALTCFRSRHGGFNITAAGRVQTPTLAILAKREREIQAFVSEPYNEVHATFDVAAGQYDGKWVDLEFKKNEDQPHGRPERIWQQEDADAIIARCEGQTGTVSEETKPQKQIAPQLYDLTTLQREASSRFGFSARRTLQLAQALYERHKMLTYPRTDSRYLPEDYLPNVKGIVRDLKDSAHPLSKWAANSLEKDYLRFDKRVFNNAKVSDHFAIIPTGRMVKLSDEEAKLYDLVTKRFLAVFYPHAVFEVTKRLTTIETPGHTDTFRTDGKVLVDLGWLAVYGRSLGVASGKDELVPVQQQEKAAVADIRREDKQTNPPARYSEATLLSAMEGAGKLLDDDELREAMSERGLGTPATRASIIEGLIRQKYVAREGRELYASGKGLRLIQLLEEMKIDPLISPSMTGDWEAKLRQMEQGQLTRPVFMKEIIDFTEDVVGRARKHMEAMVNRTFPDLDCVCPNCGAESLKTTDATYECRNPECTFRISKYIAGKELKPEQAKELFTTKFLPEQDGFVSRFNKPFSAALELKQQVSKTGKLGKWKTGFVFDSDEPESADDLSEDQLIGTVLLEGESEEVKIYETEKAFHVPDFKPSESPDGFRLGKTILQKELPKEEVLKLLKEGKTGLIPGFVSKRTKRPFSAHLTLDSGTGKIGFEFPPRKAAKKAKKAAKKSSD